MKSALGAKPADKNNFMAHRSGGPTLRGGSMFVQFHQGRTLNSLYQLKYHPLLYTAPILHPL